MKKTLLLTLITSTLVFSIDSNNTVIKETDQQVERIEKSYQNILTLHAEVSKRITRIKYYIKNSDCIQKNYQIIYFNENIKKIENESTNLNNSKELSPKEMKKLLQALKDDYANDPDCQSKNKKIKKIIEEENK